MSHSTEKLQGSSVNLPEQNSSGTGNNGHCVINDIKLQSPPGNLPTPVRSEPDPVLYGYNETVTDAEKAYLDSYINSHTAAPTSSFLKCKQYGCKIASRCPLIKIGRASCRERV